MAPMKTRLNDLTLGEIYDLEAEHPPMVGVRTAVFLALPERASFRNSLEQLARQIECLLEQARLLERMPAHPKAKSTAR